MILKWITSLLYTLRLHWPYLALQCFYLRYSKKTRGGGVNKCSKSLIYIIINKYHLEWRVTRLNWIKCLLQCSQIHRFTSNSWDVVLYTVCQNMDLLPRSYNNFIKMQVLWHYFRLYSTWLCNTFFFLIFSSKTQFRWNEMT